MQQTQECMQVHNKPDNRVDPLPTWSFETKAGIVLSGVPILKLKNGLASHCGPFQGRENGLVMKI